MSQNPPPPDRPTERLQPSPPPRDVYEERVATAAVDAGVLARIEDALSSLRTGRMIVGVLAVAALGVAIYALVDDDERAGSRSGLASDERVSDLEDRVDAISRQVQDVRSGDGGDDELAERV
ncbi:MAG TPA: hypothetical protein VG474_08055, partial [Solirubrobacteraceae bacterium]|nr:hypothetical protein [Solirubrobacteraceae bacterium]